MQNPNYYKNRIGLEAKNNKDELMKIVEYHSAMNVIVEFQDEWKRHKKTTWQRFKNGSVKNPHDDERIGLESYNTQGYLMRIIDYKNSKDMTIEFICDYPCILEHIPFKHFYDGNIKNPSAPSVFEKGICDIYNANMDIYKTWNHMLERCFSDSFKQRNPIYKDVICCKEWLSLSNFNQWVLSQENYKNYGKNHIRWALDKDILCKGNKLYSPETCCLVPINVNSLFTKANSLRGKYPIGVSKDERYKNPYAFRAMVRNPFINKDEIIGYYDDPLKAFNAYKKRKEEIIKQVAEEEYKLGNIAKQCYDAMLKYEVEITD